MAKTKKLKKWYKRWWVWVIAVIIVLIVIGSFLPDTEETTETEEPEEETKKYMSTSELYDECIETCRGKYDEVGEEATQVCMTAMEQLLDKKVFLKATTKFCICFETNEWDYCYNEWEIDIHRDNYHDIEY